jgi:alpha-tubulin suppressor-like RCC1 family protein
LRENIEMPKLVLSLALLALVALGTQATQSENVLPRAADPAYTWGKNGSETMNVPTSLSGLPSGTVSEVVTSNSDTYFLIGGEVWAYGPNASGQLGDGNNHPSSSPVQVQFPAGITIAWLPNPMPYDTGLAVDTAGKAWGWGNDRYGALCNGNAQPQLLPIKVHVPEPVTAATGAGGHALYYSNDVLYSCGDNQSGQLGDGSTTNSESAVTVDLPTGKVVAALTSSWEDSGALMTDHTYYNWGFNAQGELGTATAPDTCGSYNCSEKPIPVPGTFSEVSEGGSGDFNGQTLAVLYDGDGVEGWGNDTWGQLCDGNTDQNITSPELVSNIPSNETYVVTGGWSSYFVEDGNLYACGYNNDGQIGNGGPDTEVESSPVGPILSNAAGVDSTAGVVAAVTSS